MNQTYITDKICFLQKMVPQIFMYHFGFNQWEPFIVLLSNDFRVNKNHSKKNIYLPKGVGLLFFWITFIIQPGDMFLLFTIFLLTHIYTFLCIFNNNIFSKYKLWFPRHVAKFCLSSVYLLNFFLYLQKLPIWGISKWQKSASMEEILKKLYIFKSLGTFCAFSGLNV